MYGAPDEITRKRPPIIESGGGSLWGAVAHPVVRGLPKRSRTTSWARRLTNVAEGLVPPAVHVVSIRVAMAVSPDLLACLVPGRPAPVDHMTLLSRSISATA